MGCPWSKMNSVDIESSDHIHWNNDALYKKSLIKLPNNDNRTITKCPFIHGDVTMTNLTDGEETQHCVQKIAGHTLYGIGCQQNQCHAAMMDKFNLQGASGDRSKDQVMAEATEFLTEYYKDCHPGGLAGLPDRLKQVRNSVNKHGYYFHTTEELTYGVKLSWRNASKCIMRSQWKNIQVVDARGPSAEYGKQITNEEIFNKCIDHLRTVGEKKVTFAQMTVFPQLLPGEKVGRRIWNSQLMRFAGYSQPDGSVLGDPANVELTDVCLSLGWTSPANRTAFDVLPLIVQASDDSPPFMKEVPEDAHYLVKITHPKYPKLSELDLKWHAVPAISSFACDIGGIQYTCSPFSGWYMDAEIAARNLCDVQRYNLLQPMAKIMGLDTMSGRELVRDRAQLEMTAAVLHSFDQAKMTMADHYSASESYIHHHKKEIETRGFIPSDWVWIVPPIGGSINQVFHQEMVNFFIKPNFIAPSHTPKQLLDFSKRSGFCHFITDDEPAGIESNPNKTTVNDTQINSVT